MLGRIIAVSVAVAIVILVTILNTTQPSSIGPLGILMVFILMYVSVVGMLTFVIFGVSRLVAKISSSFTSKKPVQPLILSKSYYFSSVIALAPVMLVGMQSVGEVGVYDVLLIILFLVIACVYISKRTS